MNIIVIVQARMTSTRLPGKVMMPLGNKTVLGQVLARCKQIIGITGVCCAIPLGEEHDILVVEVEKYGCSVFRGSEKNVLERYYQAAKQLNADVVMRVTSDCPLIDPQVCSKVLEAHLNNDAGYTCNNMPPSWPHGYDCEVFDMEQLEQAMYNSSHPDDFEHVTEWMRRSLKVANLLNPKGNQHHVRITLDTPEDYKVITKIYKQEGL